MPLPRIRALGCAVAVILASCFGDTVGPRGSGAHRAHFAFAPAFSVKGLSGVDFDHVRIRLAAPGGGATALDTVVAFPATDTSLTLNLTVPITGTSEDFDLWLALINAAGDTVFRGGPTLVTATAGPPGAPAVVPLVYVGVGANAASVRYVTPVPATDFFGDTVVFAAQALDSTGQPIPGTPIVYAIDARDTLLAKVPDPSVGRVVAKSARGRARVIAELLTPHADTTPLAVQPLAAVIGVTGGNAQSGPAGAALAQPVTFRVKAADSLGVAGVAVAFAVTSGGGTLSASTATTDTAGYASIGWTVGTVAGPQAMTATVTGLVPATATATALGGTATQLAFTVQPASTTAGTPFGVTVTALDAHGNTATAFTDTVAVAITGGTGKTGAALRGTKRVAAVAGVATFSALSVDSVGTGYTLTASNVSLTNGTSSAFNVAAAPASRLLFTAEPPSSVTAGNPFPVTVAARDSLGNAATTFTGTVTVAITGGTGKAGAHLSGTTSVSAVAGAATFANLSIDSAGTGYTLTASTSGLASATSTALAVVAATGDRLAFTTQPPASVTAGAGFGVALTVRDSLGNTITGFVDTVTVAITTGTGKAGATLRGTKRVAAVAGVATFSALSVDSAGAGYTLTATAPGLNNGTSGTFNVVAAPASRLAFTTQPPTSVFADSAFAAGVTARDSLGNTVTSFADTVTMAITTGTGKAGAHLTGTTSLVAAGGVATFGALRIDSAGTGYTLTAASTGVTSATSASFSVTPASLVASTVVTPNLDTLTALGATVQLTAQGKSATGGNVSGSYTWASRATGIATVNSSGLVAAVANGTTYVVATEAGGTKDSALIVVQQRLASLTVSPSNKNIYLGAGYTFTASGVDALGNPMTTALTITWSSTAPSVATVDATGLVTGVGLGTAQIKATSGSVSGLANAYILTPITRIAVAVDTGTGTTAKTDTATLTALTATRRYHAYAYDTLNSLMPSVTQFTWASTNPSVAGIPNQTTDTITATSAANGLTTIKATAQGFTSSPGALLTVAQKLASIKLSPATATVGVGGQTALQARGLDSLNNFISGGSFTYVSKYTNFATVSSTGIVTGVAVGTDTVVADSGALTSNPSVITVSNSVPLALSFGRDTVAVGRGSSTSIPILLSTPVATGGQMIVKLGVSPAAYAHWSTPTVTVLSGQTSVNATLVGDSAGTTSVTATDSSGVYAAASAVAKVTANMVLASTNYYLNVTDAATTQVLLSDPSPAGGTYVAWSYGTPGVAAISPDPAFIPAGQLAADIQIRALAAGTTTITPTATGVNGLASSLTAYAPVLNLSTNYTLLGLGQYQPNVGYVWVQANMNTALPVTLTSSDTTKATVTPTVTIPVNLNYAYYTVTSAGLGRAAITPAASGWTAANTDSVVVTTPHVGLVGGGTIYTTSGIQYQYVYSEDSTKTAHYRTSSLLVSLRSSDTTVMKVIDTLVTINAGTYSTYGARVTPGGLGGTAWIVASAGGHTSDSVQYTVLGPPLAFNWSANTIGVGEQDSNGVYVYVPNSVTSPLVVHLTSTDTTKASVPDSVIIPTGTNYVYFTVKGLKTGVDTFTATAPGYQTATGATYTVTTPTIILNSTAYQFNNFNAGTNFYVYSADTVRRTHARIAPDTVTISVRNPAIATVDSATAIIAAGQSYNSNRHVTPVDTGSTYVVVTAAGGQVVLDSLKVTVVTPLIQINFGSTTLGRRQHLSSNYQGFYIYTPDSRTVAVPATMALKHATVDTLTTLSPTIPSGTNYVYLDAFGLANGTDTITVSATGYNSGNSAFITVTTPKFTATNLPSSTTTTNLAAIGVNVSAADSIYGYSHYTMDTVTVHAVSSDTTVIKPDSAYYHIAKNTAYVPTSVHVFGPGSASMTYSDSANSGYLPVTTNPMTVTGPSLLFSQSSTVLGMRQTTGANGIYVYTQNTPTSPVVVHLKSTDTLVVTVPDSVIIPTTTNYVYFPVNAMDTLGTIQVQATATGFGPAAMTVQVTRPKFAISTASQLNTTSPRTPIYVYAQDANGTTHFTTDTVIVHLASSAPSVATVDSAVVTIPKGQNYNNSATWGPASQTTTGTAQLSATDSTAALYAYQQATYNVSVVTPTLSFYGGTQALGLGQYNSQYVASPNAATAPIVVSLAHPGTARTSTSVNGVAISVDTIPTNSTSTGYFHVVGTAVGMDTLVASATNPPFNPATGFTAVSQGHVDQLGSWPATLSLSTNDSVLVYLYARDSTLATHYVQDSTTFTLTPSGSIGFVIGGVTIAVPTSIVIPKDQYYVTFYVKGVATGTGQATISATNYVTYTTPAITVSP